MSKLTLLHINIIGAVVSLIVAVTLWFLLIKPVKEQTDTTKTDTASTQDSGGTPDKVAGKKRELKKTQGDAKDTQDRWASNERFYMPKMNFDKNRDVLNLYQNDAYITGEWGQGGEAFGLRDMPGIWGKWLENWYATQLLADRKKGKLGVLLVGADDKLHLEIPSYPVDPNAISQLTSLTFPEPAKVWKVTVSCHDFNVAMDHLRKFNTMRLHGMPVINNVRITGVGLPGLSPVLFMTYELAIYIIPHKTPPRPDALLGTSGADTNSTPGASGLNNAAPGGRPGGPPPGGPPPGGRPGGGGSPGGRPRGDG